MDSTTAPAFITATCVECHAHARTFELADADTDDLEAYYTCGGCGHTITLALCP